MKLTKKERFLLEEVNEVDQQGADLPEVYLEFLNSLQEQVDTGALDPNEINAMVQVHSVVSDLLDQCRDKSIHRA